MNNNRFVSEEIEKAILAYIIYYPDRIQNIIPFLEKEDFYFHNFQNIYQVIVDIYESNKNVEIPLIINELRNRNQLDIIGGPQVIADIVNDVPLASSINEYMMQIIEKSNLRKADVALKEVFQNLNNNNPNLDIILNKFEEKMIEITRGVKSKDFQEIKDVANALLEDLLKQKDFDGLKGVSTGLRSLDKITSGLQKGDLIILAARPSMGKTAFALNLASNVASQNNRTVVFFSLEMPSSQLVQRILASETGIAGDLLKKPNLLTEHDWLKMEKIILGKFNRLNLFIDDSAGIKLNEMIWKTKRLAKKLGKIDLVVIDYLQLINIGERSSDNRQLEVSKISRSLKQLAREVEAPVIALSQLSRNVEKREDKRPMMSDLRESGAIEQDADIIQFLYRENYYTKEVAPSDIQDTTLIIAKHRNGAIGDVQLKFNPKIGLFFEEGEN